MVRNILVTTGEPAGIGPDLCVLLHNWLITQPITLCGDINVLRDRAKHHKLNIAFHTNLNSDNNKSIPVIHIPCNNPVEIGRLDHKNSLYVINVLKESCDNVLNKKYSAIVTTPVHKGIICKAGISFSGHTEFFEQYTNAKKTVMCLATNSQKVALMTTHLPLIDVTKKITPKLIKDIIKIIDHDLQKYFINHRPKIGVCGLNPHAGEIGYLGREEIDIINPTLNELRSRGFNVSEAQPADTIFIPKNMKKYDVILAMYHDQGLPVIKASGFGECVNITLGLPIIRTSVDHGTALDYAGSSEISTQSLKQAIITAIEMTKTKCYESK